MGGLKGPLYPEVWEVCLYLRLRDNFLSES